MSMTEPLKGRVAAVLNTRELAINIGSQAGVLIGMKFRVLEPEESVCDPDTQEIIGYVQREKIRVKVVELQEKLAVGRTYETYPTVGIDFRPALFGPPQTHVRTLASDDALSRSLSSESSFVKAGDPVIQVLDED